MSAQSKKRNARPKFNAKNAKRKPLTPDSVTNVIIIEILF